MNANETMVCMYGGGPGHARLEKLLRDVRVGERVCTVGGKPVRVVNITTPVTTLLYNITSPLAKIIQVSESLEFAVINRYSRELGWATNGFAGVGVQVAGFKPSGEIVGIDIATILPVSSAPHHSPLLHLELETQEECKRGYLVRHKDRPIIVNVRKAVAAVAAVAASPVVKSL
jgi:hypothetical protein